MDRLGVGFPRRRWIAGLLLGVTAIFMAAAYVMLGPTGAVSDRGDQRAIRSHDQEAAAANARGGQRRSADGPPQKAGDSPPAQQTPTLAALVTPQIEARLSAQRHGLDPRNDGWQSEALVEVAKVQLGRIVKQLAHTGTLDPSDLADVLADVLAEDFACSPLRPPQLAVAFRDQAVVVRRPDRASLDASSAAYRNASGLAQALAELAESLGRADTVESEIIIHGLATDANMSGMKTLIQLSGRPGERSYQDNTTWDCLWKRTAEGPPRLSAIRVREYEEIEALGQQRQKNPWFADCTQSVLGQNRSFGEQLVYGLDHWLKRVERAHRMHVFSNHGLAVGDVNGDGLDDVYVCQPGGLPNRLFVQNTDGTATDRSEWAGVDWLDATSSALLVDLDNDSDQDLVLATLVGLLIMANDSAGRFELKAILPTGDADMQSLSAADYDNDGDLDLYICLNFPKVTAETSEAPSTFVYHDANDGAPNRLFRNDIADGQWRLVDVTRHTGMDVDNRRHSLAAAWEDYDNDGDQDLYVANDYGQNCLYRNDAGQFVNVARDAGVVDFGSGMSVSWGDYNRDGLMDLYVGNMFSSAGSRITSQPGFRPGVDRQTRDILRRFAKGNSLFQNLGNGQFREVGAESAVEMGRWAWSSIFLDINNNGWEDIFVANGYITTEDTGDL